MKTTEDKTIDYWMYDIPHKALVEELGDALKGIPKPAEYLKEMRSSIHYKWSSVGAVALTLDRIDEMHAEHDVRIKLSLEM